MTDEEKEDWDGELGLCISGLYVFHRELEEGDLSGIDDVIRQMSYLRKEQINLEDDLLDQRTDKALEQIARLLNDCEKEKRRVEEEEKRHNLACRALALRSKESGQILEQLRSKV